MFTGIAFTLGFLLGIVVGKKWAAIKAKFLPMSITIKSK